MKFDELKPGMVVYDVHSERMGNTMLRSVGVWEVKILSVAPDCVTYSWNYNREQRAYRGSRVISKWRKDRPVLIRDGLAGQMRLETRAEAKARKSKEAGHAVVADGGAPGGGAGVVG